MKIENSFLARKVLKYTFGIVPIVAGLDKFTNVLTDWTQYVSIGMADLLPFEVTTLMAIIGIVEIGAGILVLIRPFIGSYVVSAWLTLIALSLLFTGSHMDVAVRDLVMAVGAFTLAKLSEK